MSATCYTAQRLRQTRFSNASCPKGALVTTAAVRGCPRDRPAIIGARYIPSIRKCRRRLIRTRLPDRRRGAKSGLTAASKLPLTAAALARTRRASSTGSRSRPSPCACSTPIVNPTHEFKIADYLAKDDVQRSKSRARARSMRRSASTSAHRPRFSMRCSMPGDRGLSRKASRAHARRRVQSASFTRAVEWRRMQRRDGGGRSLCAFSSQGRPAGAAACALLSKVLGEENIVGINMGGTSFDVSVVRNGRVNLITQGEIDRMPVRLPMVESGPSVRGAARSRRCNRADG